MLHWTGRGLLLLVVLIYFMVGSVLSFSPERIGIVGLEFIAAETSTAIRTWGGFFFAAGFIGSAGVILRRWSMPSAVAICIVSGCVVTARVSGIVIDGVDERQLSELRDEGLGLAIALGALFFLWLAARRQ
ncbi:MAG: hypothetical protein OEU86_02145 [Gammaproteobacteria bacterium]|nr:hypothetical protein [Gammaproteobacteria bacterium]